MPPLMATLGKENGFFRNISIPNEHILRKRNIGPKDIERKKKFPQIMKMILVDDRGKIALLLKHQKNDNRHGESRYDRSRKIIHAINRAKPMGFERHNPINGGKR